MDDQAITKPRSLAAADLLRDSRQRAQTTRRTYVSLAECLFNGRDSDLVLSDRQRSILSQLLRQLIGDIDAAVRWAFVARLDEGAGTRRSAWSTVASDSGTLTYTIMLESGLLRDMDLIEAVAQRLFQHQLERTLSSSDRDRWTGVSTIEKPGRFLDLPVAENSPLERRISAYIVDRSRRIDTYGNPVLLAGDIDPVLYERLHWRVAAVLRRLLIEDQHGDPQLVDALIEPATKAALGDATATASAPSSAAEAAASIEAAGLLNGETILRLLRAGEIPLFEAACARLAGIRPVLLRRLVYEDGGQSMVVLGRALGMTQDMVATIHTTTRSGHAGFDAQGRGDENRIGETFDRISRETAEQVRAYWARTPEFTAALWEAESGLIAGAARNPYG